MDMITNSMMSMLQTTTERQSTQSADKSGGDSEFKSLLEKHKNSPDDLTKAPEESKPAQKEKPAAPAKTTQGDDGTEVNSDLAAQLQSAWLNTPVVQPVVTEEVQPIVAEAVEMVTDVTEVVLPDTGDAAPLMQELGTEAVVEVAEQAAELEAPDFAPVTELPVEEKVTAPEIQVTEDAAPKVTEDAAPEVTENEAPEVTETVVEDAPEVKAEVVVTEAVQNEEETPTTEDIDTFQPIFQDVETAPIKVAEAPVADEAAEAQSVQDQVVDGLAEALANGETKIQLSLTPETLGNIKVEISQNLNGAIHISLMAESLRTSQLLERNMDSLQGLLSRNDGQAKLDIEIEVELQKQDAGAQTNAQYDGNNGSSAQEERAREEQHRRYEKEQHSQSSADFLQQMRLGLIPVK